MIRRPPRTTLFPYTTSSDLNAWRVAADEVGPNALKSMNSLPKLKTVAFRTLSNSAIQRRRIFSFSLNSRETFKSKMNWPRSEEHTSELQSHSDIVCRLLLEK